MECRIVKYHISVSNSDRKIARLKKREEGNFTVK